MVPDPDVRWKQRFQNFQRALDRLRQAVELTKQRELSDLEKQGLIQGFEFTHELAWNTLKDYLESQGEKKIYGSRDATRRAFRLELIENGEDWMDMIESRNRSVHIYNEDMAADILHRIINRYFPSFNQFAEVFAILEKESV